MFRMLLSPTMGLTLAPLFLMGCAHVPAPLSRPPTAMDALLHIRKNHACGVAVQANAKIDHFGERGRFRGELLLLAAAPARLRMDVMSPSPFNTPLATLTSTGSQFALSDLREKHFFVGPATACNIARLLTVPLPGHVLVDLLRGVPPVLKQTSVPPTIEWNRRGYYVISMASTRQAREEIHVTPHPDDVQKPWAEQRMRLLDVQVSQRGEVLYHADLSEHESAPMAERRLDPDGLTPPIEPSGPTCHAEIPRKIHMEVPSQDADVLFRYDQVTWNPPLAEGVFTLGPPPNMPVELVTCE